MGRRYFCEYCNKSFLDHLPARKRHITSALHLRCKKQHYDSFRDAETILTEESSKQTCKRYSQTGECPFGDSCRFTHYSQQDLRALRAHVDEEQKRKIPQIPDARKHLATWLQKRSTSLPSVSTPSVFGEQTLIWPCHPDLLHVPDLPPSLRAVTLGDFKHVEFNEWG